MKQDQFKKMDEAVSRNMKKFQSHEVPSDLLDGFSRAVNDRIREREGSGERVREHWRAFGFRALVPAFALFLLFFTPLFRGYSPSGETGTYFSGHPSVSEMADEVSALRAVGAWNEDDDKLALSEQGMLEEAESVSV